MEKEKSYYLSLDVGTDSVGYAVTDEGYDLQKFKGEPMWGVTLFDGANTAAERRAYRTARRRLDRRQQRVALVNELFATEIGKVDPNFFIRRKESALYGEDTCDGVQIFRGDGITDEEYHRRYPTIHHLILELMKEEPQDRDVRLVYLACAWLVAHRGHFLLDVQADNVEKLTDFKDTYQKFRAYFIDQEYVLPWSEEITADEICDILQREQGVKRKKADLIALLFQGKKASKEADEAFPYSREGILNLLSGGSVKPEEIFCNDDYAEIESVSLGMDDEKFVGVLSELSEDGELLQRMRAMWDCAQLKKTMNGYDCISRRKVAVYDRHKQDLKTLKYLVKKYAPEQYDDIFRNATTGNYASYSKNIKSCSEEERNNDKFKFANKETFGKFLEARVKNWQVEPEDKPAYEDMLTRLGSELRTFLPKQTDGDNRVIPQQLYRYELKKILDSAEKYLPFLTEKDEDGLTVKDKILSVFDFKIPYFVGPLRAEKDNEHAWLERKAEGKIYPWNFKKMVDFDASEEKFIAKMLNTCTYLTWEEVLPVRSLLYSKFTVLNELNNLKVNGNKIPVQVKRELYLEVFQKYPRVTVRKIRDYLEHNGYMQKGDELSGLDVTVKASLKSYHIFKRLFESKTLIEEQAEQIIRQAAYTEDKRRLERWLEKNYPNLSKEDCRYLCKQDWKGFGRLSRHFLAELYGTAHGSDGEAFTVIEALWNTNENLMQLLSDRYTYSEQVQALCTEYYTENPMSLEDRLDKLYVSNSVKRPIYRTLEIVADVVKATGCAPKKIFVEMARGGTPEQKGKRTKTRREQLLELYKEAMKQGEDVRHLQEELEKMGETADNRLQSNDLFLYYLQLGKDAYTGKPIELSRLGDGTYNQDHIYPRCYVKDDSIFNNLVLVDSQENKRKDNNPVPADIRQKMKGVWWQWKESGLMTEEKYRRLTRATPFTEEERWDFINRQLVETRQSTKVLARLLQERYPESEIVYVKAGLVSEFRQEFGLVKCRAVNDLHHAKDAYLNIVVGNVYDERFSKRWFSPKEDYSIKVETLFGYRQSRGDYCYWNGSEDLGRVKKIVEKNAIHLTRYAFCRKGGLFDQQPLKKGANLIPRKNGLPAEKYGGYNRPTASFFLLARYTEKKKREVMLVPINLMDAPKALADKAMARKLAVREMEKINGKRPENVEILLNGRPLKINTVFSLDGTLVTLANKNDGGKKIGISPLCSVILGQEWEKYIKAMESYQKKSKLNPKLRLNEAYDGISKEKNRELYDLLTTKMKGYPFKNLPNNQAEVCEKGAEKFAALSSEEQVVCLMNLLTLFGSGASGADLTAMGGSKGSGATKLNSKLSNWKKKYKDVRIVDLSASGLFARRSENLLELL